MLISEVDRMRVWYDACTGPHVRYGISIKKRLGALGHHVVLTTRKHPDTVPLAKFLNEKVVVVGRYNPRSLLTRLRESAQRQLLFSKILEKEPPDVAISHGSVDHCRSAFALGIPIVTTLDTPYAEAVHRLTLPLTDYLVVSAAIPKEILNAYNVKGEILNFSGVDEVAWITDFTPKIQYHFGKPLIVVRQIEEKASYAKEKVNLLVLAKELTRFGKVVFLSRYNRRPIKGLVIPKGFVDSASLAAQADLFIGAGGTITREAALQGTPSIVIRIFPRQHVNDFLSRKGFPIHYAEPSGVLALAETLLGKKRDVKHLLAQLENPIDLIADIIKKMNRG
jgi:predicted glycosyltransferase